MTPDDRPTDEPPRRPGVDADDIRKALEAQARNRPPRLPSEELPPEPKLPRVFKPIGRRRRKP